MFEDSFVSARVDGSAAGRRRWLLLGSVAVQVAVAGLMVVLPMLDPERLVARVVAPRVFVPLRPTPPRVVAHEVARTTSVAALPQMTRVLNVPGRIPHGILAEEPGAAPAIDMAGAFAGTGMGESVLPGAMGDGRSGASVVVAAAPAKKVVRVSAGVTAGLLTEPIRPVYPAIAKAAHVSGEVVVAATISPEGRIEALRVVSGPAMLAGAAVEAIRRARYRPFLLNGEPTAVETTVTVEFRLGG